MHCGPEPDYFAMRSSEIFFLQQWERIYQLGDGLMDT